MSAGTRLARFLAFSSEITAFSLVELEGTGQAEPYLDATTSVVGIHRVDALLDAFARAKGTDAKRKAFLRREVFGDPTIGPIARNIAKLWYVGIWYELPLAWVEANGIGVANTAHTISPEAYTEGLLWPAIGANPPGAKAPGYASWIGPPQIPPF